MKLDRPSKARLVDLLAEVLDRELLSRLTGDEYDALTTEQITEMDQKLFHHTLEALEGFELEIPPSDAEAMAAQAADNDEGRWDDHMGPAAA